MSNNFSINHFNCISKFDLMGFVIYGCCPPYFFIVKIMIRIFYLGLEPPPQSFSPKETTPTRVFIPKLKKNTQKGGKGDQTQHQDEFLWGLICFSPPPPLYFEIFCSQGWLRSRGTGGGWGLHSTLPFFIKVLKRCKKSFRDDFSLENPTTKWL